MRSLNTVLLSALALAPAVAQSGSGFTNIGVRTGRAPVRAGLPLSAVPSLWAQNGLGPVELDQSNGGAAAGDGGVLTIGGQTYAQGIGCHSTSAISFDLDRRAFGFSSWVGVDDSVGNAGSVVFEVHGDGAVLYSSGLLTGADAPVFTGRVNLRGVRELVLVVRDGGDGSQDDLANWGDAFLSAPRFQTGDGTALRPIRGEWLAADAWPLDPIQAALLDTGELLTFSSAIETGPGTLPTSDPHGTTVADVYDPSTGTHIAADHPSEEVFGAALGRLSTGELIALGGYEGRVAGNAPVGADQLSRFDSTSRSWIPADAPGQARHAAAGLTLGDGSFLAVGGGDAGSINTVPALFDGTSWAELPGADLGSWLDAGIGFVDGLFPFVHLGPTGDVVIAGWDLNLGVFDTEGAGSWSFQGQRESMERLWGSAASLGSDRILVLGGVDRFSSIPDAARSAVVIDVSGPVPAVSSAGDMMFRRADHDATVLADGTVLITGGSRRHNAVSTATAVRVAEIWDPVTGDWTFCAASSVPRGYRSTSILLPDATVWTGGGASSPGVGSLTSEVFRPPYLFSATTGLPAARPQIVSAPDEVAYSEPFPVQLGASSAISRVTLVRLGSATHGINSDQRCIEVPFTQSGTSLDLTSPVSGNIAPPGAYMLFVIDGDGVPSVASMLRLRRPSPAQWQELPSTDGSVLSCRHESAMATVNGRLYLMGGRGNRPTEAFDPTTGKWTSMGLPPFEINHFQPVVLDGLVYIVGAFTGSYPNETNVPNVWTWDPRTDQWTQGPLIPAARRRGSNGAFVRNGKIYLLGGNNQGHNGGARAWFDEYDPSTQTWQVLPDAPRARDHFSTVLIGNRLVAAGGRTTTQPGPFGNTIGEVDIYDFGSGQWSTIARDIPTKRAGALAVPMGRYAVVVGGESPTQQDAHDECEALDVVSERWTTLPSLVDGRHSGGVGLVDGRIYVASGSGRRGGSPELDTLEVIDGEIAVAAADPNRLTNGSFDEGLVDWQVTGAVGLVPEGGVAAPAVRLDDSSIMAAVDASGATSCELSALLRTSGSGASSLSIEALDASQAVLASTTLPVAASSAYACVQTTLSVPAGAQSVRLTASASGGQVLFLDDVVVITD
ncbi:MAG: NPCBM/NEW2 domain-containing protein [Planctomycetes bacterium]|nr:NPCBM/NEW2 domain-containing protein [Planctomycetota bacterium]